MVSAEENQKGTGDRRQEEKAIFREDVVPEHPSTFFIANTVKSFRVIAVERGQVNIGTGLVLQRVVMIRPEACMDDESGEAVLKTISLAPTIIYTHAHPNIKEEFPAGCSTKASRRSSESNTRAGSGCSMDGIAVVLWTLRE